MSSIDSKRTAHEAPNATRRSDDAFPWAWLPFAFCFGIILMALMYFERVSGGSLVLALFLFILAASVGATLGVISLIKRKFKRAAALLLAPFIIASAFLLPTLPFEHALDLVRFSFTQGKYSEVIEKLPPAERASRIVFFAWGKEGLAVTATSEYWLVYDESGEIALPVNERSQSWKDRAKKEKPYFSDEKCLATARLLSGNYYSAAMHCPY